VNLPSPFRRTDDPQRSRRMRRGMYLLPSLFTIANIALGYYAISQSVQAMLGEPAHLDLAAKAIGLAILFDGLDGRIARMTNTTSDFGKELDSLADVITFGVAPAILAWVWGFRLLPPLDDVDLRLRLVQLGTVAGFIFLTAGAARLARFNIQANPQPSNPGRPGKKYFVGMPIPAGAGVIAAVVHFTNGQPLEAWWQAAAWAALIIALAFLMVSTWRFYNFKDINLRQRQPYRVVLVLGTLTALIWHFSEVVLFLMALTYMLTGVIWRLQYLLRHSSSYKEAVEPQ
jgi:CDP-diacylglycerol--serine O-phosphatidyltransferase